MLINLHKLITFCYFILCQILIPNWTLFVCSSIDFFSGLSLIKIFILNFTVICWYHMPLFAWSTLGYPCLSFDASKFKWFLNLCRYWLEFWICVCYYLLAWNDGLYLVTQTFDKIVAFGLRKLDGNANVFVYFSSHSRKAFLITWSLSTSTKSFFS